jgi:hypothetical protein
MIDTLRTHFVFAMVGGIYTEGLLEHSEGGWKVIFQSEANGEGWSSPLAISLSLAEVDGLQSIQDGGAHFLQTALKIEGGCLKRS